MRFAKTLTILLLTIASVAPVCSASAALKPEDGYLSPERYLNGYFGLSLTFPKELNLTPIPVQEVQGQKRWLLALGSGQGVHAVSVVIAATPAPKKNKVVPVLRADLSDAVTDPGKPVRVEIGGETFWRLAVPPEPQIDTENIVEYGAIVRDYLLTIRISTEDGPLPDGFTEMVESAKFVSPSEVGTLLTPADFEYHGPALPELGHPTAAIAALAPGVLIGHEYRNAALGIEYHVPEGFSARAGAAIDNDMVSRLMAWSHDAEYTVQLTCTRSLLFADTAEARNDGHVRPMVMITAIDPLCLQGAHFPAARSDKQAVLSFAQALAEHVRQGRPGAEIAARAYAVDDRNFVSLSGVFYGTEPGTGLRIPNRLRLIATPINGYIVVWTFVAPDREMLDRLASNPVQFFPSARAAGTNSSAE